MKRMLLAALAAIALSFSLSAQDYTGGVKGTVVNRNGRQPIEKARLVLSKGAEQVAETETLEDGSFSIPGLPDGMYTLTIVAPDFLDNQVQVTVNDGYVKNMFNLGMTAVNRITEIDDDSFGAFDMDDSGYNDNPTILFTALNGKQIIKSRTVANGFFNIKDIKEVVTTHIANITLISNNNPKA